MPFLDLFTAFPQPFLDPSPPFTTFLLSSPLPLILFHCLSLIFSLPFHCLSFTLQVPAAPVAPAAPAIPLAASVSTTILRSAAVALALISSTSSVEARPYVPFSIAPALAAPAVPTAGQQQVSSNNHNLSQSRRRPWLAYIRSSRMWT